MLGAAGLRDQGPTHWDGGGKAKEAGGGRSSLPLKLDSPDGQKEDGQAEPHSQGRSSADGGSAV